jgi:hypothetical protein
LIEVILLVLLFVVLLALFILSLKVRAGRAGELRPLPGMAELSALVARAAETGQPLHVSVGVGGVGGSATAETWAGLTLLRHLADKAVANGASVVVTVADATVLPLAQDILQQAYARHGFSADYDFSQVRFVAPEPTAYATGVMGFLGREPLAGNVMVGKFGDEYLFVGETGARRRLHQIVGVAEPQTLPLVYASADETLVGEEIFATGAYTSRLPIQIASLLTEDRIRWLLIVAIFVTAIWKLAL